MRQRNKLKKLLSFKELVDFPTQREIFYNRQSHGDDTNIFLGTHCLKQKMLNYGSGKKTHKT